MNEMDELNDARRSLERELERICGATAAPYAMKRIERFIDAKLEVKLAHYHHLSRQAG